MKRLFSTPKRAIIFAVCSVAVIAAISVAAVKSTLITKAEAENAALRDAGLNEEEASALRTKLEFDDGRFQYEVDFYSNGTEYEYLIQAKDGEIIARDIEGGANSDNYGQNLSRDTRNQSATDGNSTAQPQGKSLDEAKADSDGTYIGVDRAKSIALNHANLNESEVQFAKAKQENDDGREEYEIEFYSGRTEYDYTIDAISGDIIEYDVDYD